MAKKPDPKPLFAVKSDFYDALDNYVQQVLMLQNAVRTALELGMVNPKVADKLRERLGALEQASMSDH